VARSPCWSCTRLEMSAYPVPNRFPSHATGTMVEVDHPTRGKYLSVGNPIKLSASPTEVQRSPLLGEHTNEVLAELGYSPDEMRTLAEVGATAAIKKVAAE